MVSLSHETLYRSQFSFIITLKLTSDTKLLVLTTIQCKTSVHLKISLFYNKPLASAIDYISF